MNRSRLVVLIVVLLATGVVFVFSPSETHTQTGAVAKQDRPRSDRNGLAQPATTPVPPMVTIETLGPVSPPVLPSGRPEDTLSAVREYANSSGLALLEQDDTQAVAHILLSSEALLINGQGTFAEEIVRKLAGARTGARASIVFGARLMHESQQLEPLFRRMLVRDPDEDVRGEAATALSTAASPASISALVGALSDESSWVAEKAKAALLSADRSLSESALWAAIESSDIQTAYIAADLLEVGFGRTLPEDYWFRFVKREDYAELE